MVKVFLNSSHCQSISTSKSATRKVFPNILLLLHTSRQTFFIWPSEVQTILVLNSSENMFLLNSFPFWKLAVKYLAAKVNLDVFHNSLNCSTHFDEIFLLFKGHNIPFLQVEKTTTERNSFWISRGIPRRTRSSHLYSSSGGLTLPSMGIQMEFLEMWKTGGHLSHPAQTPSTWRFLQRVVS